MASLNSCSLFVKRVGEGAYIYAQGRVADGATRRVYIAPHDCAGRARMERFLKARTEADSEKNTIDMTAKALRAAGMLRLDTVRGQFHVRTLCSVQFIT